MDASENSFLFYAHGLMRFALKLWSSFLLLAQAASGASIDVTPPGNGVPAIVVVSGPLVTEDASAFRFKTASLPSAAVILNSDGGNLAAGIGIGEMVRMKGFFTFVVDGARCASACAIAWLGGTRRFMSNHSLVGFHSAAIVRGNTTTESGAANAILGAYLNSIGLSPAAIWYVTEASPQSMNWLTFESAAQHGIGVEPIDASQVSTQPAQAPPGYATSLERRTTDLVTHLLSADDSLDALYADSVAYYGKLVTHAEVMADKWKYRERWPERRYQAKPGSMAVSCNGTLCNLTLVADWSVANPKSGAAMRGVAQYEYGVDWAASSPRINAEGGSVLSREKLVNSAPSINEWLSKLWSK